MYSPTHVLNWFRAAWWSIKTSSVAGSKGFASLNAEQAKRGVHFSLRPWRHRTVYFRSIPRGEYNLEVRHRDYFLKDNRKSLVAELTIVDPLQARETTGSGLTNGKNGLPFSYAGGGTTIRGQIRQSVPLKLVEDKDWIRVRLSSTLDRFINIDNVRLSRKVVDLRSSSAVIDGFQKIVSNRGGVLDVEYIVYSDIDLNIVDGSSIWFSSMISILASQGRVMVISKRNIESDVIWSNVKGLDNVELLTPLDFGIEDGVIDVDRAINIIKTLDHVLPYLHNVVIRGLSAAEKLCANRQFFDRSCIYLTDFYDIVDGERYISEDRVSSVSQVALQAGVLLCQTDAIREKIEELSGFAFQSYLLPPPIPDDLPEITKSSDETKTIRIGYAGKITPNWGVDELLDWSAALNSDGVEVELHIVANRISNGSGAKHVPGFREQILAKIEESGANHYDDFNREQSMELMAKMDFVWCYRPSELEDITLELSTKLVEMAAAGAACICYPSDVNKVTLGEDYPFFIRSEEEFRAILAARDVRPSAEVSDRIRHDHSLACIADDFGKTILDQKVGDEDKPVIVFAGHDFKFIDPYISHLKVLGYPVLRDTWGWGTMENQQLTNMLHAQADIVFCEWGLANAVWYSQNKVEGTKLFIRIHLQEINARAEKFGHQINHEAVDGFIFVDETVRKEAIRLFGFPVEKTIVIPNFLLDGEYVDRAAEKHASDTIRLGMVGIIPQRKRFDRAVDLLSALLEQGYDATLSIKGPRPEQLDFMLAPGRAVELIYYDKVYKRIQEDERLSEAVSFAPWGNDVALWYRDIDFILSPSDFESFHYALADGILSGCDPILWDWEGAGRIYQDDWLVRELDDAVAKVVATREMAAQERMAQAQQKRDLLVNRYGYKNIFERLSGFVGLETKSTN